MSPVAMAKPSKIIFIPISIGLEATDGFPSNEVSSRHHARFPAHVNTWANHNANLDSRQREAKTPWQPREEFICFAISAILCWRLDFVCAVLAEKDWRNN